jgi:hypothetical protein
MHFLTREQQKVLGFALALFLVGLAVKAWRLSHPDTIATAANASTNAAERVVAAPSGP